jgi:hypothetical protein
MEFKLEKLKLETANIDGIYYIQEIIFLILKIYFKIEKKIAKTKNEINASLN